MNQKKTIPTWLNVLCLVLIVGCLIWTVYDVVWGNGTKPPEFNGEEPPAFEQGASLDTPNPSAQGQEEVRESSSDVVLFNAISDFIDNFKLCNITVILVLVAALFYCLLGYSKPASPFFKIFLYLFTFYAFVSAVFSAQYLIQFVSIIQFGILCALSLSINLGKKRSYIYTMLFIACAIIKNIIFAVGGPSGISANLISELILMMILGIMVYAKYQDKAARGTN